MNLLSPATLNLEALASLGQAPPLFAPGDIPFWQDPRVAPQVLQTHLDPSVDLASRRPEVVTATVDWLLSHLRLREGARVLDLGCGPGLYCEALARRGMMMTGVDFSESSLRYAIESARSEGLRIEYIQGDYTELELPGPFDAVLLIFGDLCALPDAGRDRLLLRVHDALEPAGAFVLDVTTMRRSREAPARSGWEAYTGPGFWRNGPHLVLTDVFHYPQDEGVTLDQYIVIVQSGDVCLYRNWLRDYTEESLRAALSEHGLVVEHVFGDLAGAPVPRDPLWLGVVARRM